MADYPQTYVFDLDGVIYRGDEPQPHASETVRKLRLLGRKVFFFTNNATRSRNDYAEKLRGMDIPVSLDEIMTSAHATALYLKSQGVAPKRAYVVGEEGLIDELEAVGIEVDRNGSGGKVNYVVVGLDRTFNYEKLTCAQQAILAGAKFIATNCDATFPLEDGYVVPGGGTMVSAVQTASGQEPIVIGKPETYAIEMILRIAGSTPAQSVMVGDRLETDILVGNRFGMHTVLITTGVSDEAQAMSAPNEMKPGRIIHNLIELLDESWCIV